MPKPLRTARASFSDGYSCTAFESCFGFAARISIHLSVRNGDVPSLRLNANLMRLTHYNDLGPAKNDPSSFNFVSTDLELDHGRITSKVIDIDGYGVDLDGSGTVSLSGSDELNYQDVAEIVSQQGL